MGARPNSFKKQGGFLNGVVGTITGYRFTDDTPSKDGPVAFKPGKRRGPDGKPKDIFHTLRVELFARADGAKEDVSTYLFAGGADDYVVSEDGLTLTDPKGGPCTLGAGTDIAILITSLVEAGFPEEELPEDENSVNFESIVGRRVKFARRRNADATEKRGQRVDKKTGRKYDQDNLIVEEYLGVAEEAPAKSVKAVPASKPAAKATAAKAGNGKVAAKTTPAADVDVAGLSTLTLHQILDDNEGSIAKVKLSTRILERLMGNPNREDVRKWLFNDENLSSLDGIEFDRATGIISKSE